MNKSFFFVAAGILSGFLSWGAAHAGLIDWMPGLAFGTAMSAACRITMKTPWIRLAIFAAISTLAYLAAYNLTMILGSSFEGGFVISFPIAGLVGAFIMLTGYTFLIAPVPAPIFLIMGLVGGLTAAPFGYSTIYGEGFGWLLGLFLLWQTAMAIGLSPVAPGPLPWEQKPV